MEKEIFKHQGECEAAKGLPVGTLRKAKKLGSPGFYTNGRVDWSAVSVWLKENQQLMTDAQDDVSLAALRAEGLKLDNALKKIELGKAEGKYVERISVLKLIRFAAAAQKNLLTQKLQNELPSLLVGKSVAEITTELEKVVQEICIIMQGVKL